MGFLIAIMALYCFVAIMVGLFPLLRLKHARRLRRIASFHASIDKRWDRPKRRAIAEQFHEQSTSLDERWERPARFSIWLLPVVAPVLIVFISAMQRLEESPESTSSVLLLVGSTVLTLASVAIVALLLARYRRGDERPFASLRQESGRTLPPLGKRGKRALAAVAAFVFIGFMIWANRPIP